MPRTGTFLRTIHPRLVRFACDCFAYGGSVGGIPCTVCNSGALPHRDSSRGDFFQWEDPGSRGIPLRYARDLAPARCRFRSPELHLAPQATGIQGAIPADPGIRGPLHPPRRRCPPSPYRCGYASVGRLAGRGASTLSMLGLFRNGPLDAGLPPLRLGSPVQSVAAAGRVRPFRFGVPLPVPAALPHGKSVRGVGQS